MIKKLMKTSVSLKHALKAVTWQDMQAALQELHQEGKFQQESLYETLRRATEYPLLGAIANQVNQSNQNDTTEQEAMLRLDAMKFAVEALIAIAEAQETTNA